MAVSSPELSLPTALPAGHRRTGGLSAKIRPNTKQGYVPQLDGMRAIAIAAVLGAHSGDAPGGVWGVDIFLVLSGYLITSILYAERTKTGRISIGTFYGRRMLRLFPAVLAVVLIFVAIGSAVLSASQGSSLWGDTVSIFTYSANVRESIHPMIIFGHFWSLSLEEQFYFVWPLLMLLLVGRVSTKKLIGALIALWSLSWIAGAAWYATAPSQTAWIMTMLPTRGMGLFIGSALGLAVRSGLVASFTQHRRTQWAGPVALAMVVGWIILFRAAPLKSFDLNRISIHWGEALITLTTTFVILHAVSGADSLLNRILANRWLVILGIWSYSLYLVHQPIFILFSHFGFSDEVREPAMILTSLAAAAILHHLVERPFLTLRDRLRRPVTETPVVQALVFP